MKNCIQQFNFPSKSKKTILALGAESVGNFSVYKNGIIYYSENFGDLLNENNFTNFKKSVLDFLKNHQLPNIVLTDLHPEMKTTLWGKQLAKKFKATHIKVQHHHAHIFSQFSNFKSFSSISNLKSQIFYGIALDGTGLGLDEKIWGGEIFTISNAKCQIQRIGHLENQILIGGDLAIREPARMLISILEKFLLKKEVYELIKKYYSKNQFELLWNQLQQNFNCQETSSTGRILDAVSVLLGFAKNERNYKHQATDLLEKNSTKPYTGLKTKITKHSLKNHTAYYILHTTHLFEYLIKNLHRDKKRLATTAQLYIAQCLHEIIKKHHSDDSTSCRVVDDGSIVLSGGISNNKIILNYFESKKILQNKKSCVARGDTGLSFGQIVYFLTNPRD